MAARPTPDNMTLLCTHHHKKLHEGGFSIVKEADDTLRFLTADGRTIPRCGYRLEDFVDDDVGDDETADAPRGGFCTTTVQREWERAEVREPARGLSLAADRSRSDALAGGFGALADGHHDLRQVALHRRAHEEARDRQAGIDRELVDEQDAAVLLRQEPPAAFHVRDRTADAVHVDARVRRVVEPEHVLERSARKKIGLIVCTNRSARPSSSSSSFLQLTTFGTYSGAISQAVSTSQIAVGGASTSAAIFTSTVNGRSPRSAFTRISRAATALAVDPGRDRACAAAAVRRTRAPARQRRGREPALPWSRSAAQRASSRRRISAASATTVLRSVPMPRDLDLDRVAGLHPDRRLAPRADAARRARHDDVAGLELRPRRAVLDELRHVEAQLADALVLHDRRRSSASSACSLRGSGISSAVTSHGPNAPLAWKFLPGVNCRECRWKSRTLPSLKQL